MKKALKEMTDKEKMAEILKLTKELTDYCSKEQLKDLLIILAKMNSNIKR